MTHVFLCSATLLGLACLVANNLTRLDLAAHVLISTGWRHGLARALQGDTGATASTGDPMNKPRAISHRAWAHGPPT